MEMDFASLLRAILASQYHRKNGNGKTVLNQQAAAAALGITVGHLGQIINGHTTPTQEWLGIKPEGSEKTRLEILQACTGWEDHETDFMKLYDGLKAHSGRQLTPLNFATIGGRLGAILDSQYDRREKAAAALGMNPSHLNHIIDGSVRFTKKWLGEKPEGSEKTRLEILQACTGWKEHGQAFREFYEELRPHSGASRAPLNLATIGGRLGAILDSQYDSRKKAAAALGVADSHLNQIIHGRDRFTKKWLGEKPEGSEKTRLEILQACKGWKDHEAAFMKLYDGLKTHSGGRRPNPLNLATIGGRLGAILDSQYDRREKAAAALGIKSSSLSQIIRGVAFTKKWLGEKPEGSEETRLEILQACTGWKDHEAAFMEFYARLNQRSGLRTNNVSVPAAAQEITQPVSRGLNSFEYADTYLKPLLLALANLTPPVTTFTELANKLREMGEGNHKGKIEKIFTGQAEVFWRGRGGAKITPYALALVRATGSTTSVVFADVLKKNGLVVNSSGGIERARPNGQPNNGGAANNIDRADLWEDFKAAFPTLADKLKEKDVNSISDAMRLIKNYWTDEAKFVEQLNAVIKTRQVFDQDTGRAAPVLQTLALSLNAGDISCLLPEYKGQADALAAVHSEVRGGFQELVGGHLIKLGVSPAGLPYAFGGTSATSSLPGDLRVLLLKLIHLRSNDYKRKKVNRYVSLLQQCDGLMAGGKLSETALDILRVLKVPAQKTEKFAEWAADQLTHLRNSEPHNLEPQRPIAPARSTSTTPRIG